MGEHDSHFSQGTPKGGTAEPHENSVLNFIRNGKAAAWGPCRSALGQQRGLQSLEAVPAPGSFSVQPFWQLCNGVQGKTAPVYTGPALMVMMLLTSILPITCLLLVVRMDHLFSDY